MAVLYITEYDRIAFDGRSAVQAPQEPALTVQTVAIGGSSTQSAAFNSATRYIEIHTDAVCSYLIGSNPTATASKTRMAANTSKFVGVVPGQKLAVITNS